MNDSKAFETEFLGFQDQLKSYLYRLVSHRQESEDLFQEVFIKAFEKRATFKGNASFKTWVFAIATNLAKDSLRAKTRWGENWMNLVKDAHVSDPVLLRRKFEVAETSPHGKFVMSEHLNYCFDCTSKTLLLTHQVCLLLKEVYAFKIAEIVQIIGQTEGKVKHAIAAARKDMVRIFEHKCALINKQGICSQCTGLNKKFNPAQNSQIEANKLKIVKEQKGKNYQALLDLRLQMVASIDPLKAEAVSYTHLTLPTICSV